ncbi:putative transcription factor B3-Domain family [Helianthus anomalus]
MNLFSTTFSHNSFILIHLIFFKEIPYEYNNRFLINAQPNNQVVIKCVNGKEFEVLLTKHKGAFVFMDGWNSIVAKLSFTDGCFLMFKQIELYSYLLTPFKKMQPHPILGSNVPLFTSMSTEKTISNVEYFCQRFTQESNDNFAYFLYDSWDNVVSYVPIYPDYYVVMRYIFKQNFQLIVYDLNGCEVLVRKRVYTLAAINIPKPGPSNIDIKDTDVETDHEKDEDESDPDYNESMDDDYDDVSSISTNSDSDGMSDEEDVEVSDSEKDKMVDPDYDPIEFEWKYGRRFVSSVSISIIYI